MKKPLSKEEPASKKAPEWIPLGKISGPWGLRGDLKLKPYNASSSFLLKARRIHLKAGFSFQEWEVEGAKAHGNSFLLKLKGLETPEAAKPFKGQEIFVPAESLPPEEEGEHYVFDLKDLEVITSQGHSVGRVKEVVNYGASEILVVRSEGRPEILIPLAPHILKEVLKEEGKIVIEPMEGLF